MRPWTPYRFDLLVPSSSGLAAASLAGMVAGYSWAEFGQLFASIFILIAALVNHMKVRKLEVQTNSNTHDLLTALKDTQGQLIEAMKQIAANDAVQSERRCVEERKGTDALAVAKAAAAATVIPVAAIKEEIKP